MRTTLPAIVGALALGFSFNPVGTISSASAHGYYPGCHCGGGTTHLYKTVHPTRYVTHVRDRSVYNHVTKIHHVVTTTRVQPIIHVHDITRVHHHTIVSVRNAYSASTVHVAPIVYTTHSVTNTYDCHCGH